MAAAPVRARYSEAELWAEPSAIRPGETVWLAVKIRLDPGWHTYWLNPGDTGMKPRLTWTLPEGLSAGELRMPAPKRFESEGLVSFGFEDEVTFLAPMTAAVSWPGGAADIGLKITWLVCNDLCLPETASLFVRLDGAAGAGDEAERVMAEARARLPAEPEGWTLRAFRRGTEVSLHAQPPAGLAAGASGTFFPALPNVFDYATASVPQALPEIRLGLSPLAESFPERITGILAAGGTSLAVDIPVETETQTEGAVP
ncbi:MAG: hypothetical protein KA248_15100 [Kiritimatiellae bacterium]|nr:hypothetical protein [Kiritimatiellia bacterium]